MSGMPKMKEDDEHEKLDISDELSSIQSEPEDENAKMEKIIEKINIAKIESSQLDLSLFKLPK